MCGVQPSGSNDFLIGARWRAIVALMSRLLELQLAVFPKIMDFMSMRFARYEIVT